MNDSCNSKKRKKSFANDRLKKLRTNISNDVKSTSTESQKRSSTPSIKGSIPDNPQGYPERKKLKASRKLKTNDVNKHSYSLPGLELKQTFTQNEPNDLSEACPSKRQKIDEVKIGCSPSSSKLNNRLISVRNSSGKASPYRRSLSTDSKGNSSSVLTKSIIESNRREINIHSKLNANLPLFDDKKQAVSSEPTKKSSVCSRLEVVKNGSSSDFSSICSAKKNFEYQHKASESGLNEESCSSSMNSKNYGEYFGRAFSELYGKLFGTRESPERLHNDGNSDLMDWEPDNDSSSNDVEDNQKTKEQKMYIIVDTNIFLDSLSFLEGIIKYGSKGGIKPVIYVPWMVFNELDFIKDNRGGMKLPAVKAIDFINKMLLDKDGKLIGQSVFDANKQMYVGKSPDDKITSCCLQVKEKGFKVVLLSNDKNLRNKLIINGIPSFSCNEFLKSFDEAPPHKDKLSVILEEMSKCCTGIITECCQEAYGSVWNKLALLEKQPWDFRMCLEIFRKYWVAVFKDKLLKQFLKTVERVIMTLRNSDSLKNPSSFESFAKDCLNICFFLTDLEQHKNLVEVTAKKINSLVNNKLPCI